MRTLISGGTVVGPTGAQAADVLVEDERIVALAAPGSQVVTAFAEGARVIDASGRLVVPGGIDVHTHMDLPFGGTYSSDTFETGTRAAAWGGTTTIVDFAVQRKGEALRPGLDAWLAKAEGNCAIDYGFHMIVSDVNEQSCQEMDVLVDEGVTSFKLFMAYPGVFYSTDGEILRAMQQARTNGATIMMHAENGIAIDLLVSQALSRGETAPRFHASTRPDELEAEATSRAIALAKVTGAPLYIVHLTTTGAMEAVAEARGQGQNAFAETCPQYLFLSADDLAREGFEGAKYVCSPPLRAREHQANLWRGLRTDDLSVVSTDHCPFCFKEQKELGKEDFSKIPNGIPVVEHRIDLTYQGVVTGEITLPRWVEVNATTPARMFGLYPRKGVLAPGSDADIVLYDPSATQTISSTTHHMNVDYSAFEGLAITGRVDTVMSRGRLVIEAGRYVGDKGHGRYLPRKTNEYLL
ncbi:MAG: dihydropyrimidinase [Acidimicrobiales bacterium]